MIYYSSIKVKLPVKVIHKKTRAPCKQRRRQKREPFICTLQKYIAKALTIEALAYSTNMHTTHNANFRGKDGTNPVRKVRAIHTLGLML
jgi:hypothetical protein